MTKLNLTICLLLLLTIQASAQRTMSRQPFVGADFIWSGAPSAQIRAGQYLQSSLWEASVSLTQMSKAISTGDRLHLADITVGGDWQWRLVSNRSRSMNLYAGGGVFAGYEVYDPYGRLPDTLDHGLGKGRFIYGISADLSAEIFFCRRIALVLGASTPLMFSSPVGWFRWEASAGIRFNL